MGFFIVSNPNFKDFIYESIVSDEPFNLIA